MNVIILIVCALICYFNYKTIQNMNKINEIIDRMEENDTKRNL